MSSELKGALWGAALVVVLGFAAFLFQDVLIRKFIVNEVVRQLVEEKRVLPSEIMEGRFISTDEETSGSPHTLKASLLRNINDTHFEIVESLENSSRDNSEAILRIQTQVRNLENLASELDTLENVRARGSFQVKLFTSELAADRGRLVLNADNRLISHLLTNGQEYEIASRGRTHRFPVSIQNISEIENPSEPYGDRATLSGRLPNFL